MSLSRRPSLEQRRARARELWGEEGEMPEALVEELVAIEQINGLCAFEASALATVLPRLEAEPALQARLQRVLVRYEASPQLSSSFHGHELAHREPGLTEGDRVAFVEAAVLLGGRQDAHGFCFETIAGRLWEALPGKRRPSALAG